MPIHHARLTVPERIFPVGQNVCFFYIFIHLYFTV